VHHEIFKQRLDMRGRAIDVAQRETDITSNKTHIKHVLSQTPEDDKKKASPLPHTVQDLGLAHTAR